MSLVASALGRMILGNGCGTVAIPYFKKQQYAVKFQVIITIDNAYIIYVITSTSFHRCLPFMSTCSARYACLGLKMPP